VRPRIRAAQAQSLRASLRAARLGSSRACASPARATSLLHRPHAPLHRHARASARATAPQPRRRAVGAERVVPLRLRLAISAICRPALLTAGPVPATPTQALRGRAGGKPPDPRLARHAPRPARHLAPYAPNHRTRSCAALAPPASVTAACHRDALPATSQRIRRAHYHRQEHRSNPRPVVSSSASAVRAARRPRGPLSALAHEKSRPPAALVSSATAAAVTCRSE
jgi:hypothetical protein